MVLKEAQTDAVSAYPVSNAAVPSFQHLSRRPWCCHGPVGLTDPDPCQQLISDASLMAFTSKKEKE